MQKEESEKANKQTIHTRTKGKKKKKRKLLRDRKRDLGRSWTRHNKCESLTDKNGGRIRGKDKGYSDTHRGKYTLRKLYCVSE